jgi:hypothetical protein
VGPDDTGHRSQSPGPHDRAEENKAWIRARTKKEKNSPTNISHKLP